MDNPQQAGGGYYKKHSIWYWIGLYVIIGGVIYGLVYYFVLAGPGGSYNSGASASAPTSGDQWSN